MRAGQHIRHKNIIVPIPIEIAEIYPHGRAAGMTKREPIDRPKSAATRINPNAVRGDVVIANVEVGNAIAIQVPEHDRQSPVPVGPNGFAFLVHKHARFELNRSEMPVPIVAVQSVNFGQLPHFPTGQRLKSILPLRQPSRFAIDLGHLPTVASSGHRKARRRIKQVHHVNVMRAVKVQVTVPIDVRQRQRSR